MIALNRKPPRRIVRIDRRNRRRQWLKKHSGKAKLAVTLLAAVGLLGPWWIPIVLHFVLSLMGA